RGRDQRPRSAVRQGPEPPETLLTAATTLGPGRTRVPGQRVEDRANQVPEEGLVARPPGTPLFPCKRNSRFGRRAAPFSACATLHPANNAKALAPRATSANATGSI